MSTKIKCPGHKPWEVVTGDTQYRSGDRNARNQNPPYESCECERPMKVALTTGNNIYYSRIKSSIYLHSELFESDIAIEIMKLEEDKKKAVSDEDFALAGEINNKIKNLKADIPEEGSTEVLDSEREMIYRFNDIMAKSIILLIYRD